MNTSAAIAEVIRRELETRRMTDAELARRTGMPKATLSRKMAGASKFFAEDAEEVAAAFGWSLTYFMMQIDDLRNAGVLQQDTFDLAAKRGARERPLESQE